MSITVLWIGHASFKIAADDVIIYIDPWKLKDAPHDASVVLVSHSHYDHYSADDVAKVTAADTVKVIITVRISHSNNLNGTDRFTEICDLMGTRIEPKNIAV